MFIQADGSPSAAADKSAAWMIGRVGTAHH
jgi:hypothetical protein